MIKKWFLSILNLENRKLLVRYILISLFGYGFVFGMLFLLVNFLKVDKSLSFMITYGIWYLFLYLIQLRLLFKVEHAPGKFLRFCLSLLFFYICANIFYNIGIYFKVNYLLSTLITVVILIPFRFLVLKLLVFKV